MRSLLARLLPSRPLLVRLLPCRPCRDAGLVTAEYAMVTAAAVALAAVLIKVLKSDRVRDLLAGLIEKALS